MKKKIDGIKFRSKVVQDHHCAGCIALDNYYLCNKLSYESRCFYKNFVVWELPKHKKNIIYVMTDYKGCDYIIPGKIYRAELVNDIFYKIKYKDNFKITIKLYYCAHLNGNSWKVLE